MNTDSKKEQNEQCTIPIVGSSALKELARKYYFNDVKVEKWRDNFLNELNKRTVIDKRDIGFYCCHCQKFGKEMAFSQKNKVIFPADKSDEIWIVNTHYEGCRGWD